MKKLIVVIAAVSMGVVANAATYKWSAMNGRIYDGAATPAYVSVNTVAYLMFTSTITQDALVGKFNDGTAAEYVSVNSIGTGTINAQARIQNESGSAAVTSAQTAYFVIFANDKMYVSTEATADYLSMGDAVISFTSQADSSKKTLDASAGYSNAGWYSTASVPEPTSGLLLLLGMAGLALKRKRA